MVKMARPSGSDDRDLFFLEELVAQTLAINQRAQAIKELSDEPEVLALAMEMEGRALVIQKMARDYRPRLMALKEAKRKPVEQTTDFLKRKTG